MTGMVKLPVSISAAIPAAAAFFQLLKSFMMIFLLHPVECLILYCSYTLYTIQQPDSLQESEKNLFFYSQQPVIPARPRFLPQSAAAGYILPHARCGRAHRS